ncbi:MAG: zinc dependent phospholipase C family protein [Bacteroidota bacterium]
MFRQIFFLAILIFNPCKTHAWGFFAHEQINETAVFSLPVEMMSFYKTYLPFIKARATNPDKRRYVVEGEAQRHYIDMEYYVNHIPCNQAQINRIYTAEELATHGILPWHIMQMSRWLTRAFKERDVVKILKYSADIGHYLADACVPLHTTQNYDGQYTGQKGIHALWESRLPELFADEYNLFVGRAIYIDNLSKVIWKTVKDSHKLVKNVLLIEKNLDKKFPSSQKYCFEKRGGSMRKMHSRAYAKAYHKALEGMVEARMRKAIIMVANVWYTCWVNAGQPDLPLITDEKQLDKKLKEKLPTKKIPGVRTCAH